MHEGFTTKSTRCAYIFRGPCQILREISRFAVLVHIVGISIIYSVDPSKKGTVIRQAHLNSLPRKQYGTPISISVFAG